MELSAQEITELVKNAADNGVILDLPSSKVGVKIRAENQNWKSRMVQGKGGKGGMKKIYTLPPHIVEELREKGVLPQSDTAAAPVQPAPAQAPPTPAKPHRSYLKNGARRPLGAVPPFMQPMVAEYDDWAAAQDTGLIVPVRYHTNVFGSAGNGYEVMEQVNTEAMWFRSSFFEVLGVPPARCFCTRVKGDSMHPTLTDRGTVLWQMTARYTGAGIYLFRQVSELRIKRLQQINSFTFSVISDNPNATLYPQEMLDLRDLQDHEFEIYGRYLWDCSIKP